MHIGMKMFDADTGTTDGRTDRIAQKNTALMILLKIVYNIRSIT